MADEQKAGFGTIKFFDRASRRGIIGEIKSKQSIPDEVYFEASPDETMRLRAGQLVQFVLEGTDSEAKAKDIAVLSEQA